jgi:signal peptidase I
VDRTADRRAAVARGGVRHGYLAVAVSLAWGIAIVLLLRTFVVEPFAVPSASMSPTLRPGDHVLVDKLAYRLGDPRRRDLIVFHQPRADGGELLLKRVVAVGGDRVGIEDGVLVVDGRRVREPFVNRALVDSVYFGPVRVPEGEVFVMGDRREDSIDSRSFGPVRRELIVGRVDARIWPPRALGGL